MEKRILPDETRLFANFSSKGFSAFVVSGSFLNFDPSSLTKNGVSGGMHLFERILLFGQFLYLLNDDPLISSPKRMGLQ